VKNRVSQRLSYLQGVKRFLSSNVMVVMVNAYVHSIIDYGLDIWGVQPFDQIDQIQGKINRFLISFFLAGLVKKSKLSYTKFKKSINIYSLLEKCNFLCVSERISFVILKNTFKSFKQKLLLFSKRTEQHNVPQLVVPSFKSQIFKQSIEYKRCNRWNSLPNHWEMSKIGFDRYKELVKEWIIAKRSNVYLYL